MARRELPHTQQEPRQQAWTLFVGVAPLGLRHLNVGIVAMWAPSALACPPLLFPLGRVDGCEFLPRPMVPF